MRDLDLIEVLQKKAVDIIRSKVHAGDPNRRADELEYALRYVVCCAILNDEVPFDDLKNVCKAPVDLGVFGEFAFANSRKP